ncbi:MAG: hypothetical protein AAF367_14740 [Pseudomonadota bacterium]
MTGDCLQGTAVEANGHGLLIMGGPGSGKSALALDLIALGARLIADDLVSLSLSKGEVAVTFPSNAAADTQGLIEARSIGLVRVRHTATAPLTLVMDLDQVETERLPPARYWTRQGQKIPLLHRPAQLQPAAIHAVLQAGGLAKVDRSRLAHTL